MVFLHKQITLFNLTQYSSILVQFHKSSSLLVPQHCYQEPYHNSMNNHFLLYIPIHQLVLHQLQLVLTPQQLSRVLPRQQLVLQLRLRLVLLQLQLVFRLRLKKPLFLHRWTVFLHKQITLWNLIQRSSIQIQHHKSSSLLVLQHRYLTINSPMCNHFQQYIPIHQLDLNQLQLKKPLFLHRWMVFLHK